MNENLNAMLSQKHPEKHDDEIYIGNVIGEDIHLITWNTKRLGTLAINKDGHPITNSHIHDLRPVFVKKKEVLDSGMYSEIAA